MTGAGEAAHAVVVALFGATALGKSRVALALAEALGADVVVADSMQVYAGLPIVTNQPDPAALRQARHHMVGWLPPQEECTVAEFSRRAHGIVDGLLAERTRVVVEGGSGLYLRAVLGELTFSAAPDPTRRRELEERWAADPATLVAELGRRAPDSAARVDVRNGRRVIRALEALDGGGEGPPADELWNPGGRHPHRLFALVPGDDRAQLNRRIAERVDEMLVAGALEEVAAARAAGPFSRTAAQAIGVRELCAVLDGELTLPEAAERMKSRTRALARRQLTWMRKLPAASLVAAAAPDPAAAVLDLLKAAPC